MGKYKINTNKRWVKGQYLDSKNCLKSLIRNLKNLLNNLQHSQVYHWLDPRNYQGLERTLHSIGLLIMTGLIFFSVISPIVDIYVTHKYYSLNSQASTLVGSVGDNLAKQISYDSSTDAYIFNKDGMKTMTTTVGPDKVPLALLQAKVGGDKSKSKSLYAVSMPTNPKDGITYFDSNTGLSFQMVPNFSEMSAKQIDNHIVYPISSNTQMVYSVKNNGLKEDIILKKFVGDSLSFSYSLKLPQTLEARMLTNGSGELGIYSADPSLFNGSSSLGEDTAKIESAKLKAKKDNLLFAIPAPVIKGTGDRGQGTATAEFGLSNDGETLTVSAANLKTLHYPVSIDPTVVITSTSDFAIGNNEDNNITYPANQINRGSLTGGSVSGGWTATTALPTTTSMATSVAYNGYIYEIGGYNGTTEVATVDYAPINPDGTIGAWTATTSLPTATRYATSVTYNGYIYEIGGYNGTTAVTTVVYAPINANGTIGAWTATTVLPTATYGATSVVYNGYIYEIGGYTTTYVATVNYAPINANGTIGSWVATTALPVTTAYATSVVYNGYIYEIGGWNGTATITTVDYAPINSNGTIGTWTATTSLSSATYHATSVVYNGYIYEIGYQAAVVYAPVNANGTIGVWTATTNLPTGTSLATSVVYNGYIYEIGGNAPSITTTVEYAKIDPAGTTTTYSTTTALPAATSVASSVAYNGYVYEIGGSNPSVSTTVDYAPINTNGTIGAWTATTALPAATYGSTSVAYNGYLYEIGGVNSSFVVTATVDYAPINTNGTIGAWTATTSLPAATGFAVAVVYNGYIYAVGGETTGGTVATVDYAPINANGTIGAWTATTSLPSTSTKTATAVVYNGYIYEIGGYNGTSSTAAVYYAPINANGTVGTWTATTSLPAPTNNATAVAYNGYIYEVGGSSGGAPTSSVYYTPINANGSVGSWIANTSLPVGTQQAGTVVYNGYIYEIGGYTTTNVTTVYYAAINNGGPGTVGAWTATTVLPTATYQSSSVAYNGYVYEIGGYTTAVTANVYYAPINSNGTIGSWTATTSLPVATYASTSVAYNGYVYEIGGYTTAVTANVYYAPINSNGTIGSWTATTSLPVATYSATAITYNGYLYELAGNNGSVNVSTVNYATINSNGTIGSWTATTSIPFGTNDAKYTTTFVVNNGYIYEVGGVMSSGVATANIYYAPINTNGTIGSWLSTTSMPIGTGYATSIAYNGYLYEIGGCTTGCAVNTVSYAPFNANGTIGSWTNTTSLLSVTRSATSVVYNGYLYEIGGHNGSLTTAVSYAPLNVMPRAGHYSQMFNFGSAGVTPFSITYNGSLPNVNGLSSIQYKTAGSNAVLGASQYSTALNGTSTNCNTVGTIQYVSVFITLDDSGSATFPDVNATSANVTDYTVTYNTYHPSPNLRLRGGKFFNTNVLQPLDTCAFVPVPNSPTIGTATDNGSGRAFNNGLATVSFTPSPTGYAATSYRVTASSGGYSGTGTTSPITVNGLQSGVSYTFTVTASNSIGASNPSLASNSITATTVPQAPTIGTVTATSHTTVSVPFTGAIGGSALTSVTVTTSPSISLSYSGTSNPTIATGTFVSGQAYTFTIAVTNANGTSSVSSVSNSVIPNNSPPTVEYLVVAGGGGGGVGGGTNPGGGGGAGGFLTGSGLSVTSGSPYAVTVGGGGAGGYQTRGNVGANSSFNSITAIGGGYGGGPAGGSGVAGGSGGSGGGGSYGGVGGAGTAGQGNSGAGGAYAGGGGGSGGAGTAYGYTTSWGGGNGGDGTASSISGVLTYYTGGGGSSGFQGQPQGSGGYGIGGYGGWGSGGAGNANTGSGGGGGGTDFGGSGGSGIVIIRYANTYDNATSTTGSPTFTNTGGYKIYTFTGSGSIIF